MNKLLLGKILITLIMIAPAPAMAMGGRVDVGVSIPLPPPIVFAAPPEMVVIPETYVYVVPDVDADIFFYGGWWWRPWEGRWYRSQNYSSGWVHYQNVPSFYREVPSGWRNDYRQHRWGGRQWNYQRIPQQQVHQNWNNWEKDRHWERQNTWGVQGLKPRGQSQQPPPVVQPQRPHPQPQAKPQVREPAKPQQSRPQSREVKQQRPQPQTPKAQKQSKPQQGKPEKGQKDKQDKKWDDK